MVTCKGVIQEYTAVAAVDERHQIIGEAHPQGAGQKQELLAPVVEALRSGSLFSAANRNMRTCSSDAMSDPPAAIGPSRHAMDASPYGVSSLG